VGGDRQLLRGWFFLRRILGHERDDKSRILRVVRMGRSGNIFGVQAVFLLLLSFGLLPLFKLFIQTFRRGFGIVLRKMAILMEKFALEGQLFIIHLLQVVPIVQCEINSFWQTFF
jgi:hypothetical protein